MRYIAWIMFIAMGSSTFWYYREVEKLNNQTVICESQLAINIAYITHNQMEREEANRLRQDAIAAIYH